MQRKNIAIINVDYEDASAGALARRLYQHGNQIGHNMFVYYGRGDSVDQENVIKFESKPEVYLHKVLSLVTGLQGFFSNFATNRLLKSLAANSIDTLITIQLHGYYLNEFRLFRYAKKHSIRIVYVTADEYAGLGKCCYSLECRRYEDSCGECPLVRDYPKSLFFDWSHHIWKKKRESYDGLNISFIGPKTNIDKFKVSSLLKEKPLHIADWGIDTNFYHCCIDDQIFDRYGIPRNKVYILTVAPYSLERKGVKKYFFEAAKNMNDEKYHFINVGYDGNPETDPIPNNMTTIPFIKDQAELAKIYTLSDLYVLASTQDTMPISCLIAFACETPVCCFYTSGLRYLSDGRKDVVSYVHEISADALACEIKKVDKKTKEVRRECREYAIERYSAQIFNRKVFELVDDENRDNWSK